MMRGTTPTHVFTLPFETSLISKFRIIYAQGKKRILVKENEDCTFRGNTVTVRLSQVETFLFDHMKHVEIQLRALTTGGDVLNSKIMMARPDRCLDDEVME